MSNTWSSEGLIVVGAVTAEFPAGRPVAVCLTPQEAEYIVTALNKLDSENSEMSESVSDDQ